jgi:hypothetical protein
LSERERENIIQDTQNYNSVCCFAWVLNLVAHIEEHKLKMFENRVLRRIFGPKSDEVTGVNYIIRSLKICTSHQILFG